MINKEHTEFTKKWKQLPLDKKLIMVAECAGWECGPKDDTRIEGFGIIKKNTCWYRKKDKVNWQGEFQNNPPDFLNDLNAMHEAVNSLPEASYNLFCDVLWNLCGGASGLTGAINATAEQRAEAFVLIMGGKI